MYTNCDLKETFLLCIELTTKTIINGVVLLAFAGTSLQGCALHYYDTESKVEHVWGFGHLRMKVDESEEETLAVVQGTDKLGLFAGQTPIGGACGLGWSRESIMIITNPDSSIRLEWPDADIFNVRVGKEPPWGSPK